MALSTQPYKGARDFYPEDKRFQKWMFGKMREVVEQFGYEEYDAPLLEPLELYAAKTGEEIVNEQTYTFTDRGDRQVAIRPEMTPSVSRLVAGKRQELGYPLRWFNIGNRWRYERPQRGRVREFWQLDVDVFGEESVAAEFELIQVADAIMQSFGAKRDMYTVKINSRKLMDHLLNVYLGLNETQVQTLIRLIDRMHKMEWAEFSAQVEAILSPSQREANAGQKVLDILKTKSLKDISDKLAGHEALAELNKLLDLAKQTHISNIEFDITVMRGFDYYTGIVFEVFDTNPENNRSIFGGGRYDGLVAQFGVESVPTVGFAMGDVTLENFLRSHKLVPPLRPETDMYVILIGDVFERAQKMLRDLREQGVRVAVDTTGRKLDKQLKTALKKGIRFALFIGEQELENGQYKLKDLLKSEESTHSLDRIVSIVKDRRNS